MRAIEILAEKKYRRKALLVAILFTLAIVMLFFILGFKQPDPLPIDKEEHQEIELDGSNIEFDEPSAGGGDPATEEAVTPAPETALETPTEETSPVVVNEGSGKVDKPANNKPVIDQGLSFPGMSGSGGSGGGSGGGTGTGIGSGDGDFGNGNGGGSTGARKRLTGPCVKGSGLVPGTVYLILYVDASGKVVSAKVDRSRTTSGNERTFSAVEQGAIDCMTFEPRPGSGTKKIILQKGITVRKV